MLKSAIRSDDPVIFIEHEVLYHERGEVPDGEHLVPIGKADIKRPGEDVTLITYSRSLKATLAAAEQLAAEEIERRGDRPAHRSVRSTWTHCCNRSSRPTAP